MRYKRVLLLVVLAVAALSIAIANVATVRSLALTASQTSPLATLTPPATPTPRTVAGLPTLPAGEAPRLPLGYARVQYPGIPQYRSYLGLLSLPRQTMLLGTDASLQAVEFDTLARIWSYTPAAQTMTADTSGIAAVTQTQQWVYLLAWFLKGHYQAPDRRYERQLIKLQAANGQLVWRQTIERDSSAQSGYTLHAAPDDAAVPNVYVIEERRWVTAVNATDGRVRWRVEPCGSAAIAGNSSFSTLCGFGQPSYEWHLYSFDADTGVRHPVGFFGLPWPGMAYADGALLAYQEADGISLAAYDEFSDQFRWSRNLATDGRVLPTILLDESGLAVRIRKTVYKFDIRSGETLWQTDLPDSGGRSFFLGGQVLWAIGGTGFLHALDWRNGALLGSQNLQDTLQPAPTMWTSILAATPTELLITFPFASGQQWAIARLAYAAPSRAPNPPPTLTPYPTASPTPNPTPTPTLMLLQPLVLPSPTPAPTLPSQLKWDERPGVNAVLADVDDDGVSEWIISRALVFGDRVGQSDANANPRAIEYLLLEPFGDSYTLAASWSWESIATGAYSFHHPSVMAVTDINGDGRSEILFHAEGCGATTCFVRLTIWRWDGKTLRNLVGGDRNIEISYPTTTFTDLDGDGATEIEMRGGTSGSAGAGMQRQQIFVYKWQGGSYALAEERRVESKFALFRVVDAQEALHKGDLARALDLARQVVASPREGYREESLTFSADEEARIVSYAALQAMYVHAIRGEPERMAFYLDEIKRRYTRLSNPFIEIAQILFDQYQITRNAAKACAAAQTAIRNWGSDARLLGPSSISTEGVNPAELCPAPGGAEAPPQLPQTGGERPFNFGQLRWGR